MDTDFMTWRTAMDRALYAEDGRGGFFVREAPSAHFRTSVHASGLFAAAAARLLLRVDALLGRPETLTLTDVGAGRGELLTGVLDALPADVAARVRATGVERTARPEGLDPRIGWSASLPHGGSGLLLANEWLDNVPLDVAEVDGDGRVRTVLVAPDGTERHGAPVAGPDAAWLERWWPLDPEPGLRAEIGHPREEAWASAAGTLDAGLAVAVDYGHERGARPPFGTLTGYRDGREVAPVPDGGCDLTAHVALDACAAAGSAAAGAPPLLLTQRAALHALGVDGRRPPLSLAHRDPAAYVRQLAGSGEAAELTDPAGLGAFTWLLQPVGGCPVPELSGAGGAE